jgi:hypothetical protein
MATTLAPQTTGIESCPPARRPAPHHRHRDLCGHIQKPGASRLHAKSIRAAKIRRIDATAALVLPGVAASRERM